MRTSEHINDLATALAKAQGEIQAAHKDSDNPYFKSKYADLASVWDACRVPLSKNGLAVIQIPQAEGPVVSVETRLSHVSGQWIEGSLTATAKDASPQSVGSVITYLRRYALQSFAGVAPEDDDANAAQPQEPPKKTAVKKIADEHGMTTGDKIATPKLSVAVKSAFEKLSAAVAAHDSMAVAGIINTATERHDKGELTAEALGQIQREASLALRKIKAIENEPAAA